jgi:hypothetical protein
MRPATSTAPRPIQWELDDEGTIPVAVAEAAARGLPIVAHVPDDAAIDGWAAELLEECCAVVRYAKRPRSRAASIVSAS